MTFRAVGIVALVFIMAAGALVAMRPLSERRVRFQTAQAHLEQGIALYQRGALLEARTELRRALNARPDEWKAPYYVGLVQIQLAQTALAIPYLERALTLNPTEPKIANALGVAYFKLGRLDMAKGYLNASLELDPTNDDAKGLLATMARLQWRAAQVASARKD